MREWLKSLRTEKGLTMKDMGQKLCISESYYCAIEKKGTSEKDGHRTCIGDCCNF